MRILPIFIPHAGCRHACVYCNQVSTSQCAGMPGQDTVIDLVEESLHSGPLDEVAYYGGSFTALPFAAQESFLALLQPYLKAGTVGGIRLSTRPDAVPDEVVQLLYSYGVKTIELGCQSFSDSVLQASGRGHVAADAVKAALLLRENGFSLGIQLMPGLPTAGYDEALRSLDAALLLEPDFLRVYPTVVLASTPLAEMWRRGVYQPFQLEAAIDLCADIEMKCREQNVPVIRYGLQANEQLDGGAVLAGPYHPAFGQLVKSRLWRRALKGLSNRGLRSIKIHPDDLSDAIGHKRGNLVFLESGSECFSIEANPDIKRGFVFAGGMVCDVGSLIEAA